MVIIIFFISLWYLSLFTQSFFNHRYSAHRMFTMSPATEKFFYVLTWLFQGSSYLSPRAYGILHRMHHAFADTEKDPHSPLFSKNLFDMMWKTKIIYSDINSGKANVEERFTKNVPNWPWMEWFADSWGSRLFWVAVYVAVFVIYCHHWYLWFLLPVCIVMSPVHGAIINWYAHKLGYTNFDMADTSSNLLPFDFLMWGESYHNNHHKMGGRANFGGIKWHEFDPMYPLILLFNSIHLIKLKKNNDFNYM